LLSGIGPKKTLDQFGIVPQVVNENVGQNMQDHVYFSVIVCSQANTSASMLYNNVTYLQAAEEQYGATKTGSLTVPVGPNNGWQQIPMSDLKALNATDLITERYNQTHIEYLWESIYYPGEPAIDRSQYAPKKNESFFSITAGLVAPLSKGNVTIQVLNYLPQLLCLLLADHTCDKSNTIQDPPVINLNVRESLTCIPFSLIALST
jgi:choline dehydrogenase-like flavoprotein